MKINKNELKAPRGLFLDALKVTLIFDHFLKKIWKAQYSTLFSGSEWLGSVSLNIFDIGLKLAIDIGFLSTCKGLTSEHSCFSWLYAFTS